MKKIVLIIVSVLLCASLFFTWKYYVQNYTLYDVVEDELLYLNPFQDLQENRDFYALNIELYRHKKDTVNTQYFSRKLLSYRNSFNEKQYEETYSDYDEYWVYKEKILFEYSVAYEITGQHDSAFSCLRPLLLGATGYSPEGPKRFFELQIASKGINAVVEEIKKGLFNTGKLDCDYCPENYYMYTDFKIGISTFELALWKQEPEKLLQDLLIEYGIDG